MKQNVETVQDQYWQCIRNLLNINHIQDNETAPVLNMYFDPVNLFGIFEQRVYFLK